MNEHPLIEEYLLWLRENTKIKDIGASWTQISTPFVNHSNDMIQIYVKIEGDEIIFSDNGDTLDNLELAGLIFDTEARKRERDIILRGFGIKIEKEVLTARTERNRYAYKKHDFIQAILALDDLHVLTRPKVKQFFFEDVQAFFYENDVRATPMVTLEGKSGFAHRFEFVIPGTRRSPERYIKAVASPSVQNVKSLLFSYQDTVTLRNGKGVAILNDDEKSIKADVQRALEEYDVLPNVWSKRDEWVKTLVY